MEKFEIWKDIKSYEGLYQVSNLGRVKSLPKVKKTKTQYLMKERIMSFNNHRNGYLTVMLYSNSKGKRVYVHRLVACAFLGENDLQVNHKDLNKKNNVIENLEFVDNRENCTHYIKTLVKSSRFIGVKKNKRSNTFVSRILVDGVRQYLGSFKSEGFAAEVYNNRLNSINN